MSEKEKVIYLERLSPRALQTLEKFAKTTGHESLERTVEEIAFAVMELVQIIDIKKDPLLEPEAASRQMETMRGILQRFKRFEEASER